MKDVRSHLIQIIDDNFPDVAVAEVFPQWENLSRGGITTAICVVQVPGGAHLIPWGAHTVGVDEASFELHVLSVSAAEVFSIASALRDIMFALESTPSTGVIRVDEPVGWCDSEDVNPDFVHMQAEYSLLIQD